MSKRNSEGEITHVNWNQKQLTQICWEAKLTLLRHKPTHCPFFVLFIYLSGASESPNPCSLLGVRGSQVTKERGKAREGYRGETERLQCSRKMEQIMYLGCCKQEEAESGCTTQGQTGCLLGLGNKHGSLVSPCWKWVLNPGMQEKRCGYWSSRPGRNKCWYNWPTWEVAQFWCEPVRQHWFLRREVLMKSLQALAAKWTTLKVQHVPPGSGKGWISASSSVESGNAQLDDKNLMSSKP